MFDGERQNSGRWQGLMFLQVLYGTFKKWWLVEWYLGQIFDKFILEADFLFFFNWDLTNWIMLSLKNGGRSVSIPVPPFLCKVRLSAHRDEVSFYHDFDFAPLYLCYDSFNSKAWNKRYFNSANRFPKHEQQQVKAYIKHYMSKSTAIGRHQALGYDIHYSYRPTSSITCRSRQHYAV